MAAETVRWTPSRDSGFSRLESPREGGLCSCTYQPWLTAGGVVGPIYTCTSSQGVVGLPVPFWAKLHHPLPSC